MNDNNWLNNEIKLTIENTERLYNMALEITDFEIDNNQISNLTAATFRTIRNNSGGTVNPYSIITSFPETKAVVVDIVKNLQEEAKA